MRPLGKAAPLAASPGGARRPPTTRLALTWVISLGGGIYRVGARQGATPPSTPVHEVDCGQGLPWPGDIHIYIYTIYLYVQSRPLPPATSQVVGAPLVKALARRTGPPSSPFLPDSLPSAAPPICPSFAANWRMLGAYRDRRPEPLPLRQGAERPGPWSPLPIGTHARDEIDPPGSPRFPPACHAMLRWTDGSVAQVHAASPAVRLPSHCHFAVPPRPRRSALLKGAP